MSQRPATPHGFRFSSEIISQAVWLYHLFSLSLRDVELLLAERGVIVSYESIRRWCLKFGQDVADRLRRRRPKPGDTWCLDEMFLRIHGELHYLSRAMDQNGVVLDILVQGRRDATAAKRFFKRLLHGLKYKPERIVTDGLRSYGVAHRDTLPNVKHLKRGALTEGMERGVHPTRLKQHGRHKSYAVLDEYLEMEDPFDSHPLQGVL